MPGKDIPDATNDPRGKPGHLPSSSGDILFVLAVYGASRLFSPVAGVLFAARLPMGTFHVRTLDVPPGRLNVWAHWDGVWYSRIAAEGYGTIARDSQMAVEACGTTTSTALFPLYPLLMRSFAGPFGGPLSFREIYVWDTLISLTVPPSPSTSSTGLPSTGGESAWRREPCPYSPSSPRFFLNAAYEHIY